MLWGDIADIANLRNPRRSIRALAAPGDGRIRDLRHSFASMAINPGASLAMVGMSLGHTRLETTARYIDLADDPRNALNERNGWSIAGPVRTQYRCSTPVLQIWGHGDKQRVHRNSLVFDRPQRRRQLET